MGLEEEWVAAIKEHGDDSLPLQLELNRSMLRAIERNDLKPKHILDLIVVAVNVLASEHYNTTIRLLDMLHHDLLKLGPMPEAQDATDD